MFYAYLHAKPETTNAQGIFYVGKGSGYRSKVGGRVTNNKHYKHTVRKYGAENVLVGVIPCSNESTAFDLEVGLIKCLRRMGVGLTNLTNGGEGSSGAVVSDAAKAKISESAKRLAADPDIQKRRSKASTEANLSNWQDEEIRFRRISGMLGKKKTPSEAALAARRENGRKSGTPEACAKRGAASKALWQDPVWKAKMLAARQEAKERKLLRSM